MTLLAVWGTPLLTGLAVTLVAGDADARSRSSGGYSRPSISAPRTPSTRPSVSPSRTPSTSGGYARPSTSGTSRPSVAVPRSAGDVALSRQRSADALGAFRSSQQPAPSPPRAATTPAPAPSGSAWNWRPSRPVDRSGWYSQGGWNTPGPVFSAPRSFGIWDGLFLWSLLSNLSRPGAADFFHNQRNDPGYQEWRAEADRMAAEDTSLRRRLADLDQQLLAKQAQPIDASYLPPGVPQEVALAPTAPERTPSVADDDGDGMPWLTIAIVISLGIVGWLAWQKFRGGTRKDQSMRNLGTAGAMLRHKLSGESYRPDRLRVGMTFPFDPTPFVLASGATKVVPPAPDTGSRQLTITAIGTLEGDGATLMRLYLPDERSVFQLHLDGSGNPDECRFFSIIDQVTPADQAEWGVWLNPSDGMIGWPQFQTKDGKLYDRIWAPGGARIAPMMMTETIETTDPQPRQFRRQSMLYAAATGAAAPAPDTEYILVSAIEDGRQAWIEIAAGIDVNPGMLALS